MKMYLETKHSFRQQLKTKILEEPITIIAHLAYEWHLLYEINTQFSKWNNQLVFWTDKDTQSL